MTIPGWGELKLTHLVLDFNGTIALDGYRLDGVKERLEKLAESLHISVLTADTHGTVARECAGLPVELLVVNPDAGGTDKARIVESLGADSVVAVGNRVNDAGMFKVAGLAIIVLGSEGAAVPAMVNADIVVGSGLDALDLLLYRSRLIATLRA